MQKQRSRSAGAPRSPHEPSECSRVSVTLLVRGRCHQETMDLGCVFRPLDWLQDGCLRD